MAGAVIRTHFLNSVLRFPAKFTFCLARVTVTGCNIARTARLDAVWNLNAVCFLKILYDIKYAVAVSGTKVVNAKSGVLFDLL